MSEKILVGQYYLIKIYQEREVFSASLLAKDLFGHKRFYITGDSIKKVEEQIEHFCNKYLDVLPL